MSKTTKSKSQLISINKAGDIEYLTPLVKQSVQITGDRTTKTSDGAIARPFDPENLKQTLTLSVWHNRAIQVKATSMVGLGFQIFAKDSEEPMTEEEYLEKYPWLGQANEDESFLEVVTEMAMDRETIGDGWWEIERDTLGKVIRIYHVPGETMWLKKGKGTEISGYIQRVNGSIRNFRKFGGDAVKGAPGELLRFKNPMIGNAWYGTPDWIPALRAISLGLATSDYNVAFFNNGAIPGWLMIIKGGELSAGTDADTNKFFTQNFNGAGNTHRLLKLEIDNKDVDIQMERITAEVEDMSFEKLGDSSRDEIISAHGTPPAVMGITTPNKLGGGGELETATKIFKEITIRPKQKLTEKRIDNTLMEDGDTIKFNELDTAPDKPTEIDDTEQAMDAEGKPTDEPEIEKARDFMKTIEIIRERFQDIDKIEDLDTIFPSNN